MSENYVLEYGDPQLPKKITNKNKKRAYAKQTNSEAQSNNYVEQSYDPHNHTTRFPDGSQLVIAYGKNPRTTFHHASGTQFHIYPDGSASYITTGNHNEYKKGGSTITTDGHADARGGGHTRHNYDGGFYQDVKGDHATHVAGSSATHVAGDHNMNVSGNMAIRGNKSLAIGTQDDGGNLAMSIHMNNGRIQVVSKGDMEFSSPEGHIKFKGKNISLHGDTIALNGEKMISSSSDVIATAAKSTWKISQAPVSQTTYPIEKGVHDDVANARNTFDYQNTLKDTA